MLNEGKVFTSKLSSGQQRGDSKLKNFIMKTDAGLRKLELVLVWISGAIILFMMTLISIDVLLRYVFNSPLKGGFELIQFLFIGVVFFGISYVQGVKGHIQIDIGTKWMSPKLLKLLDIIGYIIAIFIVSIIVYQTGVEAWRSFVSGDYSMGIIQYPLWPSKSVIPIGAFVLWFRLIVDIISKILNLNLASPIEEIESTKKVV